MDYCNSVLVGVTRTLQRRLQYLRRGSTGVLTHEIATRNATHWSTYWLKIPELIQFRLCILTYRRLHGIAPSYLAETPHLSSGVESRRRLRSGSFNIDITRADHTTNYTWRSSISSGRCVGLECSADVCQNW